MKNLFFLFFVCIAGKVSTQPFFEFTKYEEKKYESLKSLVYSYHIEPDYEQQISTLKSVFNADNEYVSIVECIRKFRTAVDSNFYAEIKNKYEFDFELDEILPLDEGNGYYKFFCLDFNKDKKVDLYLMPWVYFGPSLGFIAFTIVDEKITHYLNKAGNIVKLQKRADKFILQYETTIIEDSETNVLETLIFDSKNNELKYDSKIYYANDTKLPKKIKNKGIFELINDAALRTDKRIDESAYPEDWFHSQDRGTQKLRGNVVADFPAGARGFILAEAAAFVFVAFNPDSKFLDSSLKHGMESPHNFEVYEPIPRPYICGWLKKDQIKKMK